MKAEVNRTSVRPRGE